MKLRPRTLIKKIQHKDSSPLDIAKALRQLITEFGYLQEEAAEKVRKKRSTIANYLRLLSLPFQIQEGIQTNKITMGHAKSLLTLGKTEKQLYVFERIVLEGLSVRETERMIQKIISFPKSNRLLGDCFLKEIENKLQQRFGTKAVIQGEGNKGRLCLEYYDLEDLERLLELCGVNF